MRPHIPQIEEFDTKIALLLHGLPQSDYILSIARKRFMSYLACHFGFRSERRVRVCEF